MKSEMYFRSIRMWKNNFTQLYHRQIQIRRRFSQRFRWTSRSQRQIRGPRIPGRIHAPRISFVSRVFHRRNSDLFRQTVWNESCQIQRTIGISDEILRFAQFNENFTKYERRSTASSIFGCGIDTWTWVTHFRWTYGNYDLVLYGASQQVWNTLRNVCERSELRLQKKLYSAPKNCCLSLFCELQEMLMDF